LYVFKALRIGVYLRHKGNEKLNTNCKMEEKKTAHEWAKTSDLLCVFAKDQKDYKINWYTEEITNKEYNELCKKFFTIKNLKFEGTSTYEERYKLLKIDNQGNSKYFNTKV
jgi:hypothetical protein